MKDEERDTAKIIAEPAATDKAIPDETLNSISGGWVFAGMPLSPQLMFCSICKTPVLKSAMERHMKECHGK